MRRYPVSFIILTVLGLLSAMAGAICLAGFGSALHPVLNALVGVSLCRLVESFPGAMERYRASRTQLRR